MKRLLTYVSLITLGTGLPVAAQTVQKFSATKANSYGITYTLPTTALDIAIEIEFTDKEPGEFYKYAKKYFNIDNPIAEPSRSVTVKSVTVNPRGVADPAERYLVQLKGGATPFMMINEENLPLSVNTERRYTPAVKETPAAQAPRPTALQTDAARQALGEEIMQSQSTAKRAELAAAQIFALRQSRTDLITGQADQMPPDGQAMQLIMDNITAQEAALMAMFTGTEQTHTDVYSLTYTPDDEVSDLVIARVSPLKGAVDAADLSGDPIYLSLSVTERGKLPVNEKGETVEVPKDAFIYRIPGKAQVTVSYDGALLSEDQYDIAQFGVIYGLKPNSFTDKKAPAYAILDPTTGAIVEIGTTQPQ